MRVIKDHPLPLLFYFISTALTFLIMAINTVRWASVRVAFLHSIGGGGGIACAPLGDDAFELGEALQRHHCRHRGGPREGTGQVVLAFNGKLTGRQPSRGLHLQEVCLHEFRRGGRDRALAQFWVRLLATASAFSRPLGREPRKRAAAACVGSMTLHLVIDGGNINTIGGTLPWR